MPRDSKDDLQRRRLRNVYEQNRRRVTAVANARDRNRRSDDESAPRQFVVTERRTRREGFGRGGTQTRQVSRRNKDERQPRRFADRNVGRRGDRFERDEDRDRERRRFRRNGRDGGRQGNKNQRLSRRKGDRRGDGGRSRGRAGGSGKNLDDQLDQYKGGKTNGNNGERRQRQRGGDRGAGGNRGPITKESLDAQLLAFKQSIATTNAAAAQQTANFPSI